MLFVCYVTIDPADRDESLRVLKEQGLVQPAGVKLVGSWISVTQHQIWSVFESDTAESISEFFEPWLSLNVHEIAPVMDFDAFQKIVDAKS
jgi:hypothetical protein